MKRTEVMIENSESEQVKDSILRIEQNSTKQVGMNLSSSDEYIIDTNGNITINEVRLKLKIKLSKKYNYDNVKFEGIWRRIKDYHAFLYIYEGIEGFDKEKFESIYENIKKTEQGKKVLNLNHFCKIYNGIIDFDTAKFNYIYGRIKDPDSFLKIYNGIGKFDQHKFKSILGVIKNFDDFLKIYNGIVDYDMNKIECVGSIAQDPDSFLKIYNEIKQYLNENKAKFVLSVTQDPDSFLKIYNGIKDFDEEKAKFIFNLTKDSDSFLEIYNGIIKNFDEEKAKFIFNLTKDSNPFLKIYNGINGYRFDKEIFKFVRSKVQDPENFNRLYLNIIIKADYDCSSKYFNKDNINIVRDKIQDTDSFLKIYNEIYYRFDKEIFKFVRSKVQDPDSFLKIYNTSLDIDFLKFICDYIGGDIVDCLKLYDQLKEQKIQLNDFMYNCKFLSELFKGQLNLDTVSKMHKGIQTRFYKEELKIIYENFSKDADTINAIYRIDLNADVLQYYLDNGLETLLIKISNMLYDERIKREVAYHICGEKLSENQACAYLNLFQSLDECTSNDIKLIKDLLIEQVLESESPESFVEDIIDVFEKNGLPVVLKIFNVFQLLYPKYKIEGLIKHEGRHVRGKTLGIPSPILHKKIIEGKSVYPLIFKDLVKISIKSGDSSLINYLNIFVGAESELRNFEDLLKKGDIKGMESLSNDAKRNLLGLFKKISRLYNTYYKRKDGMADVNGDDEAIDIQSLINYYDQIKVGFKLKEGESIYEKLSIFTRYLGYNSFEDILHDINSTKLTAHKRGLEIYESSKENDEKIDFPKRAFLKAVGYDAFCGSLQRGITSREYLGGNDGKTTASSDSTPFDTDGWLTSEFIDGDLYGNIHFVIDVEKHKESICITDDGTDDYHEGQYELFYTGVHKLYEGRNGAKQYGIRTGIAITEVDYIIYTGDFNSEEYKSMCYELVKKGYYIPITDKEGKIIFTPEDFDILKQKYKVEFKIMDVLSLESTESIEFKKEMIKYFDFYTNTIMPIIHRLKMELKGTENEILQEDEDMNHGFNKHTKNVVIRGIFYALLKGIDPIPVIIAGATHDLKHINIPGGGDKKHGPQALPLVDIVIDEYNKIGANIIDDEIRNQIKYAVANHMSDHGEPDSMPIAQCLNDADRTRIAWRDGYSEKFFSTAAAKVLANGKKEQFIKYFQDIGIDYDTTSIQ